MRGQPRAFIVPGHDPPALLQPVEFAQTHPCAFRPEMEEGQRPGDGTAAAGDAIGGVAAQAGQRVAGSKPHGRIGGPDRQEDGAGRSLAAAPADGGEQRVERVGALGEAGLHPALGGARHREQRWQILQGPLSCPAAKAPRDRRRRRVRRPPGGEAHGIERARTQWRQRGGGSGGRGEWAGGRPCNRRSRRTRLSASAMVRSPSAIASNGGSAQSNGSAGPAKVCGRLRGPWPIAASAVLAVRPAARRGEIERVDPGVGVGEPAGGLSGGHAGAQTVAHRIGRGGGAGVEPGEHVGRVTQRDEQAGRRGAGQPGVRGGR